jgi:hypothetical protein
MEEKNTGQTGCSTLCMLSGKMIKKKDFFLFLKGAMPFSVHTEREFFSHTVVTIVLWLLQNWCEFLVAKLMTMFYLVILVCDWVCTSHIQSYILPL